MSIVEDETQSPAPRARQDHEDAPTADELVSQTLDQRSLVMVLVALVADVRLERRNVSIPSALRCAASRTFCHDLASCSSSGPRSAGASDRENVADRWPASKYTSTPPTVE